MTAVLLDYAGILKGVLRAGPELALGIQKEA